MRFTKHTIDPGCAAAMQLSLIHIYAWVCGKCGYIENFEADGPEENGWRFCPACGREIVIADETRCV